MANSGHGGAWFPTSPEFYASIPLSISGWQIWYDDGCVVSSAESSWASAPCTGVQVLMLHHPGGLRTVVKGRDAYTDPSGRSASVKLGREIPIDRFHAMLTAAMQDGWRA